MLRIGKAVIIWTTVVLMTVDPVSAGLFCRWRCCAPRRCYVDRCYTYCPPPCPPVSCCGPGDVVPQAPAPQPTEAGRPEAAPLPLPQEAPAPAPAPAPAREFPPAEPAPELPTEEPAPAPAAPSLEPEAPALPSETPEMPPAAEPAAPSGVDDLFNNTTPAPTEPAPTEPAPAAPKADSTDDLFKETSEPTAPASDAAAPATDPAGEPKKQEVDDLFSDPAPADKSTSNDPNAMREWTDNTGHYHVVARLVSVADTHVRLFKENGRYTTVPFERLSQADLAFVQNQATGQIASK